MGNISSKNSGKPDLALVSVAGPTPAELPLTPPGPFLVGRRTTAELQLAGDEHVSRDHALISFQRGTSAGPEANGDGRWVIEDTGSRHGTLVNGVRLPTGAQAPLREGDLIVISPWAFRVVDRNNATPSTLGRVETVPEDVDEGATITQFRPTGNESIAQRRVDLLLECAAAIHASEDEASLSEAVLDAAVRGTGFQNAALLRPLADDGSVEAVALHGDIKAGGAKPRLSRSLLREASKGVLAFMSSASAPGAEHAESIVRLGINEAICAPIMLGGTVSGYLYLDNRQGVHIAPDAAEFTLGLTRLAALALANLMRFDMERRHSAERQALFMGTVEALVASIDAKDRYTRGHSERVAFLSERLALAAGMNPTQAEQVRICGLVHDVGKIGVPEAVLCKPGRLTDEEFMAIRAHPEIGHRILKDIPQLSHALPGVLHHHERWDGKGYPQGLTGEEIPHIARLVGIADAFDAMRSARTYRGALPQAKVLEEVGRCAGTHFDPAITPLLLSMDLSEFDALLRKHSEEG